MIKIDAGGFYTACTLGGSRMDINKKKSEKNKKGKITCMKASLERVSKPNFTGYEVRDLNGNIVAKHTFGEYPEIRR